MTRRKRRWRPSVSPLVRFEEPHPSTRASDKDAALFHLAAKVRHAEQTLHTAMAQLAQAEQRLSEVQAEERRRRRPSWYVAAEAEEEAAGNALELIYQQVVQTPAHTKAGLAIKLQLAATLYGETFSEGTDDADMVSQLLRSLIADTSGQ